MELETADVDLVCLDDDFWAGWPDVLTHPKQMNRRLVAKTRQVTLLVIMFYVRSLRRLEILASSG